MLCHAMLTYPSIYALLEADLSGQLHTPHALWSFQNDIAARAEA